MEKKKILVIDETLREGMQYRGLMFSCEQRIKILEFQEALGVDISQAGYPPAHAHEADMVKTLAWTARDRGYRVRVAAMGRANAKDAEILIRTGVRDFHLHAHIRAEATPEDIESEMSGVLTSVEKIRKTLSDAVISVALLDIGKSRPRVLNQAVSFLSRQGIDILSLPDTSGMMAPHDVFDTLSRLSGLAGQSMLSVHCHNDMGLASANTLMGIRAGARVLEASVLGIGERNGIADLFPTVKMLQGQGFDIAVKTGETGLFSDYYAYVNEIVKAQTKESLMTYNTPVFGASGRTHTAGTHADGRFGLAAESEYHLNVLCSRAIVKQYLNDQGITFPEDRLADLTQAVKETSIRLNRSLARMDMKTLVSSLF